MLKFRKSIVESIKMPYIEKYGFYGAYFRLETSLNRMEKEGDKAEELALEYLKLKNIISENYETNVILELRNIKIEADIVDHDNKVIYEVKSRKLYEAGKREIKKKWNLFQHQKEQTPYQNYKFHGIVVTKNENGTLKVNNPNLFLNSTYNHADQHARMQEFFTLVNTYKNHPQTKKKQQEYIAKKKRAR
ncbi:MAG: hypothetical protein ACRCV7_06320 [Culicoidibacterales bacterium]